MISIWQNDRNRPAAGINAEVHTAILTAMRGQGVQERVLVLMFDNPLQSVSGAYPADSGNYFYPLRVVWSYHD